MRRLLILVLLALPLRAQEVVTALRHPISGASAWVVQSGSCYISHSVSTSCTITVSPTTAGNTLMYFCANNSAASDPTFTPAATATITSGNGTTGVYTGIYYAANITGGMTSVTVSTGGSFWDMGCVVAEVQKPVSGTFVDQFAAPTATSYGTGSATNFTGAVTTTHGADNIVGVVTIQGSSNPATAGTGYTAIAQSPSGGTVQIFAEYKTVSSTGTYNPGATYSFGSTATVATAAVEQ